MELVVGFDGDAVALDDDVVEVARTGGVGVHRYGRAVAEVVPSVYLHIISVYAPDFVSRFVNHVARAVSDYLLRYVRGRTGGGCLRSPRTGDHVSRAGDAVAGAFLRGVAYYVIDEQ